MSVRSSLKLPREHGAYVMLYVPFALGVLVARNGSWPVLLLALSVSFTFIGRESLILWWRARSRNRSMTSGRRLSVIYFGLAGLFAAPLLFIFNLKALVPVALLALVLLGVNALQAVRRAERTVLGEILAVVGLTMTAPAAYYVTLGTWGSTAWWLWALSAWYFSSSVFYIKLRVLDAHPRSRDARQPIRWSCAFYHSFLLGALLILAFTGNLSLFALMAFMPVLARTAWHLLRPTAQLNLRRIGVLEILYSTVFLLFITLAFSYT